MLNPWERFRDLEVQGHHHHPLTLPLPKPSPRHNHHHQEVHHLKPDDVGEWDATDHVN